MLSRIRSSIGNRLIIINCLVMITLLCFSLFSYYLFSNQITLQKEQRAMQSYLVNTLSSLDDKILDIGRASMLAYADDYTQNTLKRSNMLGYREELEASEYLQKLFLTMVTSRNDITSILLFDNEKLVSKYSLASISLKTSFELSTNAWLQNNLLNTPLMSNGARLMVGDIDSVLRTPMFKNPFDNYYLCVMREINSFSPYERVGFMLVCTRMTMLDKVARSSVADGSRYVLADTRGNIICEDSGQWFYDRMNARFPELEQVTNGQMTNVTIDGVEFCAMSSCSDKCNLTLFLLSPVEEIYRQARTTQTMVSVIMAASILLIMMISSVVLRRGLSPFSKLAVAMDSFGLDNMRPMFSIDREDEAGRLANAFNRMMDTINDLIISQYQSKIDLQEMRLKQQDMRFKYLQSQINPHFLYNTLDVIRIKASLNGDEEVAGLIMKLVVFFRFGMGNTAEMTTIRHEITLMKVYLQLMQSRYPKLRDDYDIDETLLDMPIPSAILQPLVENSLTHGLKANRYEGKLVLTVKRDPETPGDILIILDDDGVGMSDVLMEELNAYCAKGAGQPDMVRRDGIGVRNVQDRLYTCYGNGYGLRFLKNDRAGVTVFVRIPGKT
jgi:two-component system sensor histidine kinase YesM